MTTYTYDSGGAGSLPGGASPDYNSLADWEANTDNDLSIFGPQVLECYDSQVHSESGIYIQGATNTSRFWHRTIKSSDSCSTPFTGRSGAGANFLGTTNYIFYAFYEDYVRLEKLCLSIQSNTVSDVFAVKIGSDDCKVIHCVLHDCTNASGNVGGLSIEGDRALVYGCIARDCTDYGLYGDDAIIYGGLFGCTAYNCGTGFYPESTSDLHTWSCLAIDCTAGFRDTAFGWGIYSGWNASDDATADLGGVAGDNYKNSIAITLDSDGLPTSETGLHDDSGAGANFGRNPDNDVSDGLTYSFFPTTYENLGKDNIGTYNTAVNWLRVYPFYTPSTTDTIKVKKFHIYNDGTHSAQVRLGLYTGGTSDYDPYGATLFYDFGQTSGSDTNAWVTITVADGAEPTLSSSTRYWLAAKGDDAGFVVAYDNGSAGFELSSDDETVAFDGTIGSGTPATGNISFYIEYLNEVTREWEDTFNLDIQQNRRVSDFDSSWAVGASEYHLYSSIWGELDANISYLTIAAADEAIDGGLDATLPNLGVTAYSGGYMVANLGDIQLTGKATNNYGGVDQKLPILEIAASGGTYLNKTLPDLEISATGHRDNYGYVNQKLPDLEITATGTIPITGSLDKYLPGLKISATATRDNYGTLDSVLSNLLIDAAGNVSSLASLDVDLPGITIRYPASGMGPGGEGVAVQTSRLDNYDLRYSR